MFNQHASSMTTPVNSTITKESLLQLLNAFRDDMSASGSCVHRGRLLDESSSFPQPSEPLPLKGHHAFTFSRLNGDNSNFETASCSTHLAHRPSTLSPSSTQCFAPPHIKSLTPHGPDVSRPASDSRPTHVQSRGRRKAVPSMPSSRPKPSLDAVMCEQDQSRSSCSIFQSDSGDSGEELLRGVLGSRLTLPHEPHYRYPHPARLGTNNDRFRFDNQRMPSELESYVKASMPPNTNQHPVEQKSTAPPASVDSPADPTLPLQSLPNPLKSDQSSSFSNYHTPPISSPQSHIVDDVSLPPPTSDIPDADLPYALPPGPYSDKKPDLSYAALIGQAILASPSHALRLSDIYGYISTVYPFFKRGGSPDTRIWMNTIRQALTVTPQFFKTAHPSPKPARGSLWCISDEDLPCFADGKFDRYALDPEKSQAAKLLKRKRKREEEMQSKGREKRARTTSTRPFQVPYEQSQLHEGPYSQPVQPHEDPISDQFPEFPSHSADENSQAVANILEIRSPSLAENLVPEASSDGALFTPEDFNTNASDAISSGLGPIPSWTPISGPSNSPSTTDDRDASVPDYTGYSEVLSAFSEEEEALFNLWIDIPS